MKKGQLALFMVIGLLLLLIVGFYIMVTQPASEDFSRIDSAALKTYVSSCIKKVAKQGLFDEIGKHGGYIAPDGNPEYAELAVRNDHVRDYILAYHYYGGSAHIPAISEVEARLARYISVELDKCLDFSDFEAQGYTIVRPSSSVQVSFNDANTMITVHYPVRISSNAGTAEATDFSLLMPIRFKELHDIGMCFVGKARGVLTKEQAASIAGECNQDSKIRLQWVMGKYVRLFDYTTATRDILYDDFYGMAFEYDFAIEVK